MAKIDISKIVPCTDIEKTYYRLDRSSYKYNSLVNNEAAKSRGLVGIYAIVNKLKKIYGWQIKSSRWNSDDKSVDITIINEKDIDTKHFSYEDICREMWWHSFKTVKPGVVCPKPFTWEEKEAVMEAMPKMDIPEMAEPAA